MAEGRLAETEKEIARCFRVMAHLRPYLVESEFAGRIRAQQAQGYRLAFLDDGGDVVAVAGFRVMEMLASGRTLYVDDLVTDEAKRSLGLGKTMLDWLEEYARRAGCETFSLDSGTHRQEAHAFYFRERMRVTSFHFAKMLK
ncbi:MAG: GNAT family N-acetyltransferase [Acidobacteriota bacterium]|nr:GNAT family N-acetyltransferase [Acidobacteriota bacterium]